MKVDYYTIGDPWDPTTWSGTYFELSSALKKLGVLQGTYDIKPLDLYFIRPEDKKIKKLLFILRTLKYFKYYKGKVYSVSEYHPPVVENAREIALRTYNACPRPDAIIIHGDFALFDETPFFIYHDLDISTLLNLRLKGESTYICDNISIPVLKRRMDQQKKAYAKARGLLIASDWIGKSIKSYIEDPEKVYTVGMGHRYEPIDLNESLIEKRFENPQLLFIGRNGLGKGIDIILSAFETVQKEMPEARLKIITSISELPRKVRRGLAKEDSGIDAYTTGVPKDLLRELYLESSIFVLPSRFDAWGKVFFEAMAFGLPVIGARNCAMPEFIKDDYNGYTTNYDPEEVADRIISIFNSFEKYKDMSENAVKMSARYTWDKIAKNMIEIINRNIS